MNQINYPPKTMYGNAWDNRTFLIGSKNAKNDFMIFDWKLAASIINLLRPKKAVAGLNGDFAHCHYTIYEDGRIIRNIKKFVKLCSTWAMPVLALDDSALYECFYTSKDTLTKKSIWPKAAVNILGATI